MLLKPSVQKKHAFAARLLEWFVSNGRDFPWRHETDPYRVLVAEKLLQQTTCGHVLKVYSGFIERFPNVRALANAEVPEIEEVIRRLGFQRQRAKQFKEMALTVLEKHEGAVPSNKEDLLKLNGVGDYVANAVLCFALNEDVPIVDMNVRRVVGRYFDWEKLKDFEIENKLSELIPRAMSKQFNWAIIDFSALICSRKPKHDICFLTDLCEHFQRLHADR
jgi:A/G-specific adenine glycosylase